MAALRHPANTPLQYNAGEYTFVGYVAFSGRRGVRIRKNDQYGHQHTVLLGTEFEPDANGDRGGRRNPTQQELRMLAKVDTDIQSGIPDNAINNSAYDVRRIFVLNNKAITDSNQDAGPADGDNAEVQGTVPVACTCDDWKWRGVRHSISRVPGRNTNQRRDKLRQCYQLDATGRRNPDGRAYNIENDQNLAASQSGCRHMVWVRRNVNVRPYRAAQFTEPERYGQ